MIEFAQVRPVPIDRIASRVDGEVRDTLRKAAVRENDKSPDMAPGQADCYTKFRNKQRL